MISKLKYIVLCGLILMCFSCKKNQKHRINKNKTIVATIDSISITQNEVDYFVKQKLYDELSRIHLIRKIALEEIIKNKLLGTKLKSKEYQILAPFIHNIYEKMACDFEYSKIVSVKKKSDNLSCEHNQLLELLGSYEKSTKRIRQNQNIYDLITLFVGNLFNISDKKGKYFLDYIIPKDKIIYETAINYGCIHSPKYIEKKIAKPISYKTLLELSNYEIYEELCMLITHPKINCKIIKSKIFMLLFAI